MTDPAGRAEASGVASAPTIGRAFDSRDNNFNVIRLFAALLVLISHCYPLSGRPDEPFANYLGEYDTGGGWGVSIFFVISGFLVTKSALERPVGVYIRSRILRIVPALIVLAAFQAFIIGPLFSTLPLREYLSNSGTYSHLRNVSVFWLHQVLPGTFGENPVPHTVNGSIWTLPIESAFYVFLPIIGVIGLLKPGRILLLLLVMAAWLAYGMVGLGWNWSNQGGMLFVGGPTYSVVKEAVYFLIGAAMWIHRDHIPLNGGVALCCLALLFMFAYQSTGLVAMYVALPYLVMYVALAKHFHVRFYEKIGDLSYGTYLYAFPVQQAVTTVYGGRLTPLEMAAWSLPISVGLGALSWFLIEKPALAIRYGRGRRQAA